MSQGSWDVNLNLEDLVGAMHERMPAALGKATEYLRSVVTPMVPVETGSLAGSGDVQVFEDHAELYYPGPYALYVHEGVYYRHGRFGAPLTFTHGEAFYLTRGVVMAKDGMLEIMRDELLP